MRLWDLPGARRFVEDTADSLRGGNSVVIRFPGDIPNGLDDAITNALGNALQVGHMHATLSPFDKLRDRFAKEPHHVHSLANLCDDTGFRGRLIRLQGIDTTTWPAWRAFLVRYAQASRSRSLLGRTLFLVPLAGYPPAEPPTADVALENRTWDGVLDDVDLLLLANERLRQRAVDPLRRALLATAVARVASWDFDTACHLLGENDRIIMEPTDLLRAIAQDKRWTPETPLDWGLGTASGTGIAHPARAAVVDPPVEIHRRLWSAQLSVLLPWIEDIRHETVAGNVYEVKRQMRNAGNGHADPYGLELGDLHALFSRRGADKAIRRTFRRLRDVRNELAHRRHLAPDAVLSLIETPPSPIRPTAESRRPVSHYATS